MPTESRGRGQGNECLVAARLSVISKDSGAPLTRAELAASVQAWLRQHCDVDRPIDELYIGKLERGVHRWPNRHYRAAFRAVLGARTDADLGFYRTVPQALSPTAPPSSTSWPSANEPWELLDALKCSSIDLSTVIQMERAMERCAQDYPAHMPATLGPAVARLLARTSQALEGPLPVRVRGELVRLLGYLAGLSASLAIDCDQPRLAAEWFDVASHASQEADDNDLAAWVNANHAIACYTAGAVAPACELLEEACARAQGGSGPRRRAWIIALHARSLAALRQNREALTLLERARAILSNTTDPMAGTDFFDDVRLDGIRGASLLWLRETDAAEAVISAAIAARPESETKGRALLMLDLAQCRLLQNEHDEAIHLTEQSLHLASASLVRPIVSRTLGLVEAIRSARAGDLAPASAEQLAYIETHALEAPS